MAAKAMWKGHDGFKAFVWASALSYNWFGWHDSGRISLQVWFGKLTKACMDKPCKERPWRHRVRRTDLPALTFVDFLVFFRQR